jgi:hypothetical protein
MSTPAHHQLPLLVDNPYWCYDCALSVPLAVAPAGDHSYYLGYICPGCLCAVDILGVLATRELAQALLQVLDPSQPSASDPARRADG